MEISKPVGCFLMALSPVFAMAGFGMILIALGTNASPWRAVFGVVLVGAGLWALFAGRPPGWLRRR